MKTIYLAAALLLASSAAHAGSSIAFNVGGHDIRIMAPRNCQSLSCLQISGVDLSGLKSGKFGSNRRDDDDALASSTGETPAPTPSMPTVTAPTTPVAPVPQAYRQPQPAAPVSTAARVASAPVASAAPAPTPSVAAVAPMAPAPVTSTAAAGPIAPPAPIVPAAPLAQPAPAAAAAPVPDPNSPLGLWATEENKGNVRIEPCGGNLCGYAEKTGEKVLINMRPKENKWVGRIHDPDGGGNYDSTIALKGPNTLRVQGCAFGGLFCGGQTWKRVG
jgi:uncharacterized protein (DUF2147 family)